MEVNLLTTIFKKGGLCPPSNQLLTVQNQNLTNLSRGLEVLKENLKFRHVNEEILGHRHNLVLATLFTSTIPNHGHSLVEVHNI